MLRRTLLCTVLMAGCQSGPPTDVADVTLDRPPVTVAGMRYATPVGWVSEAPSSPSRIAQYRLPADAQAGEDARLVVYYFGERGAGSVDANLDRWIAQFELPEEGASRPRVVQEQIDGLIVHRLDLRGTYAAETAPGAGQRVHEPDYRLLAAIVKTEAGPYYIKLVGPSRVVERWEETFDTFINELRAAPANAAEPPAASHP